MLLGMEGLHKEAWLKMFGMLLRGGFLGNKITKHHDFLTKRHMDIAKMNMIC